MQVRIASIDATRSTHFHSEKVKAQAIDYIAVKGYKKIQNQLPSLVTSYPFFIMFATRRLLQSCRITLFTRETCGLCTQAKGVLSDVWDKRPFAYTEVNIDLPKPESSKWRDLYDFDVPVVYTFPSLPLIHPPVSSHGHIDTHQQDYS